MAVELYTHAFYEQMLEAAVANKWRFISFEDAQSDAIEQPVRFCLLRHDCDNDLTAALKMAEIEARHGIRSTYFIMPRSAMYNPFSPPCRSLIEKVLSHGHWLGLHFDEAPFATQHLSEIEAQVHLETEWLAREYGRAVKVVSFHQPSDRILNQELTINAINTYSAELFEGIRYLSDSNLRFTDVENSVTVFSDPAQTRLQLLIHPEWWTREAMDAPAKWREMLRNNLLLAEHSLAGREDAYLVRHDVTLTPHSQVGQENSSRK